MPPCAISPSATKPCGPKWTTLLAKMDASDNKGSFLMKALHLKEQLLTYDGLGDFASLHRRLTEAEEAIAVTVAHNREKNLATKLGFIQEAEALRDSVEWVSASEKVKDLRQGWLKTGPVDKALTDELETPLPGRHPGVLRPPQGVSVR